MLLGVGLVGLLVGIVLLVAGAATGWLLPQEPPKANHLRNESTKVGVLLILRRVLFNFAHNLTASPEKGPRVGKFADAIIRGFLGFNQDGNGFVCFYSNHGLFLF